MSNPFLKAVNTYSLLEKNDSVAVALSGGADSVSLLHMLYSIKEEYNLTLYAVHINHMIRGNEAERDESFCREYCKRLGVELFVKKVDVPVLSAQQKISMELCGRNVRYNAFEELSKSLDCKVATAHTLSDNAETLMINLARGTSLHGLCAIPERRDYIIRPLIFCDRTYIENYCRENSLEFVTDSTNLTDDYTRNKIRHNVIPGLKKVNPGIENTLKRLCDDAKLLATYLDRQTDNAISDCRLEYGYSTESLCSRDKIIRQNAIKKICIENGAKIPEHIHIELIDNILFKGGAVDLYGSYRAVAKQGILRIENTTCQNNSKEEILFYSAINNEFIINGYKYSLIEITDNNHTDNNICCLSESEIKTTVLRTRRQGDKIFLKGRNITKPLRKAMNEYKVLSEQRDRLIVAAVENKVLWCEGIKQTLMPEDAEKRKFIINKIRKIR